MNTNNDTAKVYTVGDWLFGCVNFAVSQETADCIFHERGVNPSTPYSDAKNGAVNPLLLKADLLKHIVLGAGKVNSTSDQDNGWAHSDGGYTLSKDDKKLLIDEANDIYGKLEPSSVFGKKKIRIRSYGIMPANYDIDGCPLPRKPL